MLRYLANRGMDDRQAVLRCRYCRTVQSRAYPVCLDCGVRFEEEPARGVWRFVLVLIAVVTLLWVVSSWLVR